MSYVEKAKGYIGNGKKVHSVFTISLTRTYAETLCGLGGDFQESTFGLVDCKTCQRIISEAKLPRGEARS